MPTKRPQNTATRNGELERNKVKIDGIKFNKNINMVNKIKISTRSTKIKFNKDNFYGVKRYSSKLEPQMSGFLSLALDDGSRQMKVVVLSFIIVPHLFAIFAIAYSELDFV